MIYKIFKENDNQYKVHEYDNVHCVDKAFLDERIQPYKLDQLDKEGSTSFRGTIDFSSLYSDRSTEDSAQTSAKEPEEEAVPVNLNTEASQPVGEILETIVKNQKGSHIVARSFKQFINGKEYMLCRSIPHPALYELYYLDKKGFYKFVVYVFDLTSVDTLIKEHKLFLKQEKVLARDAYLHVLREPVSQEVE